MLSIAETNPDGNSVYLMSVGDVCQREEPWLLNCGGALSLEFMRDDATKVGVRRKREIAYAGCCT
jgi:hypothetical protein